MLLQQVLHLSSSRKNSSSNSHVRNSSSRALTSSKADSSSSSGRRRTTARGRRTMVDSSLPALPSLAVLRSVSILGPFSKVRRVVHNSSSPGVAVPASLAPLLRLTRRSPQLKRRLSPLHGPSRTDFSPAADGHGWQCMGDGHWCLHTHALL
ncbi:hypothetical protein ACP70R_048953 [Stipagrostis hirtigluma subsp. patula]